MGNLLILVLSVIFSVGGEHPQLIVRVLESTGPLPGAEVQVSGPSSLSGHTLAGGAVEFNELRPGTYTVTARMEGLPEDQASVCVTDSGTSHLTLRLIGPVRGQPDPYITVTSDGPPKNSSIGGVVRGPGGEPMPKVRVDLIAPDGEIRTKTTNRVGTFRFKRVAHASQTIRASAPGYLQREFKFEHRWWSHLPIDLELQPICPPPN